MAAFSKEDEIKEGGAAAERVAPLPRQVELISERASVEHARRRANILLVVRWPVGGIRTFLRYVYRNLQRDQYQFSLIAPHVPELEVLLAEDLGELGISYIPCQDNNRDFLKIVIKTAWKNEFDLVHSHGFTAGVCCSLVAKLRGIPHIMTSHDVITDRQVAGTKGFMYRMLLEASLRLVDRIQSVSHDAQANLIQYLPGLNKHREKLVTIRNGIEVMRFEGDNSRDFRNELNLNDSVYLIGFLGRFMSQKGFSYLIEAMDILRKEWGRERRAVVLAFGDGGFIREDSARIRAMGLEKYFYFMPFVGNVAPVLKGLDIVVMPSLWEACGLLAMEALVSGTPLIGTNCIGLREVLEGTPATMVGVGDARGLADAIRSRIDNPKRDTAEAFVETAKGMFDVRKSAYAFEKLLQEVLRQAR